ncbi:MAG: hypothetical protein AB1671_00075 [Thermodesulfobacteriota bacterium]|jgi:Zn-finger nucleic acid-binding protein
MPRCPYCEAEVSDRWAGRHERMCPKRPDSLTCPYCGIQISKRRYDLHLGRCPQRPRKRKAGERPGDAGG